MQYILRISLFLFLMIQYSDSLYSQRILLDGSFDDWDNSLYSFTDPKGDGRFGYDLQFVKVANDESNIYFHFDVGLEINLQDYNDIVLAIDTDNDSNTGQKTGQIGAEIIYYFGERGGYFIEGSNQYQIEHPDIGLMTLPTVSSDRFEIAINYHSKIYGNEVFKDKSFRFLLLQDIQNGDVFPDDANGLSVEIKNLTLPDLPLYSIQRHEEADFRVVSYNVLRDRLFEYNPPFERQLKALQADIYAFQEIYDHSAFQTEQLIASYFPDVNWYSAKQGSDIILVSRFPILQSFYVKGNGAFLLDINGKEALLINAHLPCCDNDSGRQDEVDGIMEFIRDSKNGLTSLDLVKDTPIMIMGDMNFVGKNRQVRTFEEGDIANEFKYGEDFKPDWDDSNLKDVRSYATHTPLAITWYDLYSSYNPGRLDYIFYTDAVLSLKNKFNLFTNALPTDSLNRYSLLKSDTEYASDHIPVVADFSFDKSNPLVELNHPGIWKVYPSPFENEFKIEFEKNYNLPKAIEVYSTTGNAIYQKNLNSEEKETINIDASSWLNGLYIIKLKYDNHYTFGKIIKRKT